MLAAVAAARGRRGEAVAVVLLVPGALAAALGWFDVHGLPVADLFTHSQISAQGGNWSSSSPRPMSTTSGTRSSSCSCSHPRWRCRRRCWSTAGSRRSAHGVPLAAAAGGRCSPSSGGAQLGPAGDWDLYAVAAQPLALLVVTWLTAGLHPRARAPWVAVLLVLAATHTAAWIAANHAAPAVD